MISLLIRYFLPLFLDLLEKYEYIVLTLYSYVFSDIDAKQMSKYLINQE